MGFCFDPHSPNFLLPIKAKEILEWTSGSHCVGEFGDQSAEEIEEISELLGVDVILLDNALLPDELSIFSKPIIKVIGLNQMSEEMAKKEIAAYGPFCDAFQINAQGKDLTSLLWIKPFIDTYKIIINVGNLAGDINAIEKTLNPFAVHLEAGNEDQVGLRDFEDLNALLDAIGAREA
jgi:phosphoribosylanthranilate isomerase